MTKHRGRDYLDGRFIDPALGAFGYEGSHLLAVARQVGDWKPHTLEELDIDNAHLRSDEPSELDNSRWDTDPAAGRVTLPSQGGAYVRYRTRQGRTVELYTSLSGIVGFPAPPYAPAGPLIGIGDTATRYRIVRLDGTAPDGAVHQVIGFYEPLPALARGIGALAVFREGALQEPAKQVPDDTMTRHFTRALDHFSSSGSARNPYSVEQALEICDLLHTWAQSGMRPEAGGDSDDVLGSPETAAARAADCARLRLPA